jgi:hypothetical protein
VRLNAIYDVLRGLVRDGAVPRVVPDASELTARVVLATAVQAGAPLDEIALVGNFVPNLSRRGLLYAHARERVMTVDVRFPVVDDLAQMRCLKEVSEGSTPERVELANGIHFARWNDGVLISAPEEGSHAAGRDQFFVNEGVNRFTHRVAAAIRVTDGAHNGEYDGNFVAIDPLYDSRLALTCERWYEAQGNRRSVPCVAPVGAPFLPLMSDLPAPSLQRLARLAGEPFLSASTLERSVPAWTADSVREWMSDFFRLPRDRDGEWTYGSPGVPQIVRGLAGAPKSTSFATGYSQYLTRLLTRPQIDPAELSRPHALECQHRLAPALEFEQLLEQVNADPRI